MWKLKLFLLISLQVLAYYISFLKTLSLKLNNHTIHFFFNEVSNWEIYKYNYHNHNLKCVHTNKFTMTLKCVHTNKFTMAAAVLLVIIWCITWSSYCIHAVVLILLEQVYLQHFPLLAWNLSKRQVTYRQPIWELWSPKLNS